MQELTWTTMVPSSMLLMVPAGNNTSDSPIFTSNGSTGASWAAASSLQSSLVIATTRRPSFATCQITMQPSLYAYTVHLNITCTA